MISELGKVLLIFSEGHNVWSQEKSLQMGKQADGFILHTPGIHSLKGRAWLAEECVCTKQLGSEE